MASCEAAQQADLKSISLAGLLKGDADTANDLVSACKEKGFFYLDFRDPSTCGTLTQVDELIAVFPATAFRGVSDISHKSYKRAGCSVGPFAEKKDGYESFSAWMGDVHGYTECILSILSKALNLSDDLKDCHRKDAPSSANMAMLNYLPWGSSTEKVGNMAHTDMGTLTVVFTKNEGLQVFEPQMRFLSNGALASNLHRVVPPANPEGLDKFSCIYFLRPEFDAKFTSHDGREMNSVEWHNQKYALFREASLDAKQHGAMLTGRNGYLGATTQTV